MLADACVRRMNAAGREVGVDSSHRLRMTGYVGAGRKGQRLRRVANEGARVVGGRRRSCVQRTITSNENVRPPVRRYADFGRQGSSGLKATLMAWPVFSNSTARGYSRRDMVWVTSALRFSWPATMLARAYSAA